MMIARLIALLGVILVVLGVLKFVGVVAFASATAGSLIVVGAILLAVAYFVLGGLDGTRRL